MASIIDNNQALRLQIEQIAEVAGYLWEKGWAERNGGNISVNLTELVEEKIHTLPALLPPIALGEPVTALAGNIFYVTGTGKRMRYVAKDPFANGSIIRVNGQGTAYEIIAEQTVSGFNLHYP